MNPKQLNASGAAFLSILDAGNDIAQEYLDSILKLIQNEAQKGGRWIRTKGVDYNCNLISRLQALGFEVYREKEKEQGFYTGDYILKIYW